MIRDKLRKKTIIATAVTSALAFSAASTQANDAQTQAMPSFSEVNIAKVKTRYIVKFKDNYSLKSAGQLASQKGTSQIERNRGHLARHGANMILHLDRSNAAAAYLTSAQLKALKKDPAVDYIEVDPERYLIESITRTFEGINPVVVSPSAETAPYGIAMVQADQVSDANTNNMKVCITDTGYDGTHEDLRPYTDAGITGDNNDGAGNDTGNWWEPGHSHGTHVAGTIAALGNNGLGVTGVNPSGLLDLHIVKVFNNSGNWGYGSDMVKAVEQCQNAGAKVISMSLGGSSSSTTEENAFIAAANAGLINIAAAGNDGNTAMSYPASYDSVMSVAAIDSSKNLASFSQRNAQVEIAAPGVGITSTTNGSNYATWDGTSMATPHVAGVAALVWSHFPSCTGDDIRQAINATAEDLGSGGRDNSYGYGLVQAKAMYDGINASGCGGVTPPPPPPPPTAGVLENGVPHTDLSAGQDEQLTFTMEVPAGASNLNFAMAGGSGDADLHVKFGSPATSSDYDCRPYAGGNNENCAISNVQTGTYHVMIKGYSSFADVSLTGSYQENGGGGPGPVVGVHNTAAAGDSITRAFAADCTYNTTFWGLLCPGSGDQPHHSWFDGSSASVDSVHDKFKAFDTSITANKSAATTGAELVGIREDGTEPSFGAQAQTIVNLSPTPDHVELIFGGNDLCSRDCVDPNNCNDPIYTEDEWRQSLRTGLNTLIDGMPQGGSILVGSVPRVQDIYQAGIDKQAGDEWVNCESLWSSYDVCRIVTQDTVLNGETQAARMAGVIAAQQRYNAILAEEAAAYNNNSNGLNGKGIEIVAEYVDESTPSGGTFSFGAEHINGGDCFHPNVATQNLISDLMWNANPAKPQQ